MTVLKTTAQNERKSERGNVLFLILIAVALFAALSYAVTQSTRSGGGDASRETNLVNAAGITQYPASIKTAITRMIVSSSIDPTALLFDTPSTFANLSTDELKAVGVFYPTGGGATYVDAPAGVMANNQVGTWHFNRQNQVINIGTSSASTTVDNADIIAFLPNVKKAVCDSIHTKLGFATPLVYTTPSAVDYTTDMIQSVSPVAPTGIIGGTFASPNSLGSQPQGCFTTGGGAYVYYHVVVER